MEKPKLHLESAPGTPRRVGAMRGFGTVRVPANPVAVFEYSSVMPDTFEVAIGHTYPTSCVQGDKVLRYSAVCVAYDERTRLASFEVKGKPAADLHRMLAGLPFDPTGP
jgi:hypothetical protein